MTDIILYDYVSTDDWWETFNCIGCGLLSAQNVIAQIAAAKGDDLNVRINSVGGSVFDGFAIYNALKSHPGKVSVRIEGLAASIASIVAMAGSEITICQAAMIMIHKPTIDPFWCGAMDADDLQREADALTQIEAVLNDIYTTRTGLGSTKVQNMIDSETWLTPDLAVMLGFADSIEKTITEPIEIAQPAFNHLFKNANTNIKAYANNAFKVKNMANPNEAVITAVNKQTEATNSLLDWFKNKFNWKEHAAKNASATLANGNAIYYNDADEFSEGTQVFEDADMSKPQADGDYDLNDGSKITVLDGKLDSVTEVEVEPTDSADVTALKAQNKELTDKVNELIVLNTAQNEVLTKLKNTKSSYTPPPVKTEITKDDGEGDAKGMVERANARKAAAQKK